VATDAPRTDRLAPVLLVDGFTPVPMPYFHIRRFYRKHGRTVRLVPYRPADMKDVVTYARHITDEACRLMDDERTDVIDVIGYSMGGVAALYAMKRMGLAEYVRTFVAYCAPFHGSRLTLLSAPTGLYTRTGRQLAPDSRFLDDLHRDTLPDGPRYVALCGSKDVICSTTQCHLDGAENLQLGTGHWTFYWHKGVHRAILEALG